MSTVREHPVRWMAAAPLWPGEQPTLLRFIADTFMDDLAALLQKAPQTLGEKRVRPESHRPPPVGRSRDGWKPVPANNQIKLYQPVHGQFSLVAASLVCRIPGLPERGIKRATERVGFVLRKAAGRDDEMAWMTADPKGWQPIPRDKRGAVDEHEELLPLFPVPVAGPVRRTLHVGLIPTASREAYQAAPVRDALPAAETDPRLAAFDQRVADALAAIRTAPATADEQVEASRFLLLDFADVLKANADDLGADVLADPPPAPGTRAYPVYAALDVPLDSLSRWRAVLQDVWAHRDAITGEVAGLLPRGINLATTGTNFNLTTFRRTLADALPPYREPPPPKETELPKLDPAGGDRYVIRCVYRRPNCRLPHADVVSPPTDPFAIAPFFDPDAPTRPIRIPLPPDASIKGLRKYARNVAFLSSKQVRAQLARVTDGKAALKGDVGPPGSAALGELCSFSIPVITLCAMVVLLIFLSLLNIVFWWLPFARLCLPRRGS